MANDNDIVERTAFRFANVMASAPALVTVTSNRCFCIVFKFIFYLLGSNPGAFPAVSPFESTMLGLYLVPIGFKSPIVRLISPRPA